MTELYRIFAWKDKGYWRGQELISQSQIATMLGVLGWQKEVFASIQSYDQFGNCLSCPLYFDFDGDSSTVQADVQHFVQACEFTISVTPKVYFSGNKGFHVIIDHPIEHPLCHLLVQHFGKEIGFFKTMDMKVYRSTALLRIPLSPASVPGYYKIAITRDELFKLSFDQIKALARQPRQIPNDHDPSKIDVEVMDAWFKTAVAALPKYDSLQAILSHTDSVEMEMTPCIRTMLTQEQLIGSRHESAFILARFFKLTGFDFDSAKAAMLGFDHWAQYEAEHREVTKILKSVFFSRKETTLGCRGPTVSADIMRQHCDARCHFSPNFPKFRVIDLKGRAHDV